MRNNFGRDWIGIFALSFFLMASDTFAFELSTHGAVTRESYGTVIARNPNLLQGLGINDGSDAFGDTYFILVGQTPVERPAAPAFEGVRIRALNVPPLSVAGWLMRGAMREDDDNEDYEPNPKVDPEGDFHRVLRHWFDPTASGSGALSPDPCALFERHIPPARCLSALDWALGTLDAKQSVNVEDVGRRNHFSVRDAREAMWRAATLLGKSSQGYVSVLPAGADPATQQSTRNKYWATTFRALGDVSHLIQDMAQPQHTRNETHSGLYGRVLQDFFTGHRSVIEQFFEASVLRRTSISVERDPKDPGKSGRDIAVIPLAISLNGYAPPAFNSYRKFWTTRPDKDPKPRGLADFSNANFFTVGNNLGNFANPYSSPSKSPQAYVRQIEPAVTWDGRVVGNPTAAEGLTYLYGDVTDNYTGVTTSVAQATYGFWDEFLEQRGEPAAYTLTRKNYEAQANLLVP